MKVSSPGSYLETIIADGPNSDRDIRITDDKYLVKFPLHGL